MFNILEAAQLPAMVVNAGHVKSVPGRKTDAKDAELPARLLQHRLLNGKQPTAKILERTNIRLGSVVQDILGMTGTNLLTELVTNGVPTPERIHEMRKAGQICSGLKASAEELIESMQSSLTEAQRSSPELMLNHIQYPEGMIADIDRQINEMLNSKELAAVQLLTSIPGMLKRAPWVSSPLSVPICGYSRMLTHYAHGQVLHRVTMKAPANTKADG